MKKILNIKNLYNVVHTIFAGVLILSFVLLANSYLKKFEDDLDTIFKSFTESLTYPSWTLNKEIVLEVLRPMIEKKAIISIKVYDDKGEELGNVSKEEKITIFHSIFGLRTKFKEYRMMYKGFLAGRVVFEYSYFESTKFLFTLSLIFTTLYFMFLLLLKNFQKNQKLNELIGELNDINSELETTLTELEETQQKVINSEKMAALGKLMMNIAHDVNTPTGIIYSSLTDMKDRLTYVKNQLDNNELTEEELRDCLAICDDLTNIMIRNTQRIKELVQSLKKVVVNEVNQSYSMVKMKDIVQDILNIMHPKLRKTKINVKVDVPDDLEVKTVPGAWAQIIMNLIDNAIVHAFDYDNQGTINITFKKVGSSMVMEFSDDGKGMDEETKRRAFEPFYSTNTYSGSGLGLSIVYQLVVDVLKGDIELESEKMRGTKFKITVPIEE
jgi:signal transduction histidine kinase